MDASMQVSLARRRRLDAQLAALFAYHAGNENITQRRQLATIGDGLTFDEAAFESNMFAFLNLAASESVTLVSVTAGETFAEDGIVDVSFTILMNSRQRADDVITALSTATTAELGAAITHNVVTMPIVMLLVPPSPPPPFKLIKLGNGGGSSKLATGRALSKGTKTKPTSGKAATSDEKDMSLITIVVTSVAGLLTVLVCVFAYRRYGVPTGLAKGVASRARRLSNAVGLQTTRSQQPELPIEPPPARMELPPRRAPPSGNFATIAWFWSARS